jgi:hypothetical protein
MNLYNKAALAITQECRIRIELLNRSLPLILQGEKLADALTGKGIAPSLPNLQAAGCSYPRTRGPKTPAPLSCTSRRSNHVRNHHQKPA